MKILLTLVVLAACAVFYPQFNEDVDSSCAALEKKIVRLVTENKDTSSLITSLILKAIPGGAVTSEMIKTKYPNFPPAVGCSIFYYEVLINPEVGKKLKKVFERNL